MKQLKIQKNFLIRNLTKIPKFNLVLDKRVEKSDGTFPVKIRASLVKTRKYYPIKTNAMNRMLDESPENLYEFKYNGIGDYSLTEAVFERIINPKRRGKYNLVYQIMVSILNEADEIARNCKPFSYEQFKEMYTDRSVIQQNTDVLQTFRNYISKLKSQGRVRTAVSYGCTLRSLEEFYQGKKIPFEAITISFLEKYEKWMSETGVSGKGNSKTTIGINMRQLRTIYNQRSEEFSGLPYPFGESKYEIPITKGRKIALETSDLKKVFEYQPNPGTIEGYYLDFWRLQYLMNGINVTDLLLLRYENLRNGFITFERHKTSRTKKELDAIRIPVTDKIQALFDKYAQPRKTDKTFIFPVLNPTMTLEEQDRHIQYFSNAMTKQMKKIAAKLEIDEATARKISSYSSRHSFASLLMKKGASVAYIQKQLGHGSLETTSNYLSGFEDKHLKEWQDKLTEF